MGLSLVAPRSLISIDFNLRTLSENLPSSCDVLIEPLSPLFSEISQIVTCSTGQVCEHGVVIAALPDQPLPNRDMARPASKSDTRSLPVVTTVSNVHGLLRLNAPLCYALADYPHAQNPFAGTCGIRRERSLFDTHCSSLDVQ